MFVDPIYLPEDFFFITFHCLRFVQTTTALGSISNPNFLSFLTFSVPHPPPSARALPSPRAAPPPRPVPPRSVHREVVARTPAPCLAAARAPALAPPRSHRTRPRAVPRGQRASARCAIAARCLTAARRCLRAAARWHAPRRQRQRRRRPSRRRRRRPVQLLILIFLIFRNSNFNIPYLQFQQFEVKC